MNNYLDNLQFKIDWVQGVVKVSDVLSFFNALERNVSKELKFENFSLMPYGIKFYKNRFQFRGSPMFIVAFNNTDCDVLDNDFLPLTNVPKYANLNGNNPYIFISISGEGLCWIRENSSIDKLFNCLKFFNFSCSRIDIACDIFDSDNDLVPTILEAFNNDRLPIKNRPIIKSNMKRDWSSTGNLKSYNNKYDGCDKITENITFGSRNSTVGLFRLYDKWFEQYGKSNKDKCSEFPLEAFKDNYWYRLEFQVVSNSARNSKKYAQQLFEFIAVEGLSSAHAFTLATSVFFSIVLNKNRRGSNLNECVIFPIWDEFIRHNIHFVQFSQPIYQQCDNSINSFKKYWKHCSKNCVALILYCEEYPCFKEELLQDGLNKIKKDKSFRYESIKQLDFLKAYFNKSTA